MSDMLSAEEVEGFVRRVEARYIDFDAFAALARSHEQLRAVLDEASTTLAGMARERDEADAAARAGGCAADLAAVLARLVTLKDGPRDEDYRFEKHRAWTDAHSALFRYDRAASGQTAEKEKA